MGIQGRCIVALIAFLVALSGCRGNEQWHEAYLAAQKHRGQAIYVREMKPTEPLGSGQILLQIAMSQIIKDDWQTVFDNALLGIHDADRFSHFRPLNDVEKTGTTECFHVAGVGRWCGQGSGAVFRTFETWRGNDVPPDGFISVTEARQKLAALRSKLGEFEVFACSGSIVGCRKVEL